MSPAAVTPPARFLRLLDAAPLRWKIASIGAVGALGMVVLTGVTVGEVASVRTAADRAVQAEQVRGQAALLDEIVTQARVAQRSFITDVHMHGASAASDEAPRRAAYLALVHRADAVVQAFPRSDQGDTAALLGDIAEQATAVAAFDTAATKAYRSGSADGLSAGDDQARQAVAAFATMRDRITLVVEQAQAASAQADADENAAIRRLFITLISCLVLACLVMVAATTYVSRRIRSAVDAVRASMNAIRSRDLTVHCEATSHDELGVLSADTEATRAELSWLIGEVNAAAHAVAQTSEQVLTQSRSVEEDSRAGASSAQTMTQEAQDVGGQVHTVAAGTEEMTARSPRSSPRSTTVRRRSPRRSRSRRRRRTRWVGRLRTRPPRPTRSARRSNARAWATARRSSVPRGRERRRTI